MNTEITIKDILQEKELLEEQIKSAISMFYEKHPNVKLSINVGGLKTIGIKGGRKYNAGHDIEVNVFL